MIIITVIMINQVRTGACIMIKIMIITIIIIIMTIIIMIMIMITTTIRCRAVNSAGESSELRTVELARPADLVEQLVIILIFMIILMIIHDYSFFNIHHFS